MVGMDNDDADLLSIGELARASGLSISALRFYDRHGVLLPVEVSPDTGYRWYAPSQCEDATLLARLRRIGLPLAEVRTVLSHRDPQTTRRTLDQHIADLEEGLVRARAEITRLQQEVSTSSADPSPGETGFSATIDGRDLLEGLATVRHAVGSDPDLPAIHGVYFVALDGAIRLSATDRYRAAFAEVPARCRGRLRALLPTRDIDQLLSAQSALGSAEATITGHHLQIDDDAGHVLAAADLLQAAFPDLSHAIPKSGQSVLVAPGHIAAALADYRLELDEEYLDQALRALDAEGNQLRLDIDGPIEPLAIRRAEAPGTFTVILPLRPDRAGPEGEDSAVRPDGAQ